MVLDAGLTLAALIPAGVSLALVAQSEGQDRILAAMASTDFICPAWFAIAGVLHLHSMVYCSIWTRPKVYMKYCAGPLKFLGSSPTHVYAHLAAAFKLLQFSSVFWYFTTTTPDLSTHFVALTPYRWALAATLLALGQSLNIGIFMAIGYDGVYYGFKRDPHPQAASAACARRI